MENKSCVIVVPVHNHKLEESEVASLIQLKNVFGDKYDICLVGPQDLECENYFFIFGKTTKIKLFNNNFFVSWQSYSNLLELEEFYNEFDNYEYMLIYQTDAWVFRDELEYWINKGYDYIGAPFFLASLMAENKFVGNGGFSLRKISAIKKYIRENKDKRFIEMMGEDTYFCNNYNNILNIASKDEASQFSLEMYPKEMYNVKKILPFGCHKPKHYDNEFWKDFIDYNIKPQIKKDMKILLCTIAKNENRYIREFVEWYKDLGFTNICLYDNNDIDGERFEDVIGDYINSGFVILKDYKGKKVCQLNAYEECYKEYGKTYDWIAVFDADEYLDLDDRVFKNINDYLSLPQFQTYDAIHINWLNFDDNDQLRYEDKPLKERFRVSAKYDKCVAYNFPENNHIKTILRGGLDNVAWKATPHTPFPSNIRCCDSVGKKCDIMNPFVEYNFQYAKLRHYGYKSTEEYCLKMKRGFPDQLVDKKKMKNLLETRYFVMNKISQEKVDIVKEILDIDMSYLLHEYRGQRSKDVKIFSLCFAKKDFEFLDNAVIQPLQVGADVNNEDVCRLKDNTGDNISQNNFFYTECTGTYWIWKNVHNCKYKGQMQYRRPLSGVTDSMNFDDIFSKYDVITCKPFNHPENSKPTPEQPMFIPANTVAEGYAFSNCKDDLDILELVIKLKYPEYADDYEKYIKKGENLYYSNGFIMREKDFDEYCYFLFNCLNYYLEMSNIKSKEDLYKHVRYNLEAGKYIRYPNKNIPQAAIDWQTKIGGFLSERIWTLWVQHKFSKEKILELPYIKMEDTMYT